MTTKVQWLEERRKGIGGSDAGAVLNVSPYAGPLDVYMDKLGLHAHEEETDPMRWGTILEPAIASEYRNVTGCKFERLPPFKIAQHPKHPWMLANADRVVYGRKKGLECKAPSALPHWAPSQWGEPGTDQVPEIHLLQCSHYMAVYDINEWDLAALIGGNDFRIYTIKRDAELESFLIESERRFWEEHVLPKRPPEAHPTHYAEYLKRKFPRDTGVVLRPTGEELAKADKLLLDLYAQKHCVKDEEERCEVAANALKDLMGDAAEIVGTNYRATWKKNKDGMKTNWKAVLDDVEAVLLPADAHADLQKLITEHTKLTPGARPLNGPKPLKEKK